MVYVSIEFVHENCSKTVPLILLFLTYKTEFVLFLAVLENSVMPMGCDSSHKTGKVTSVVYKRHLRAVTKKSE